MNTTPPPAVRRRHPGRLAGAALVALGAVAVPLVPQGASAAPVATQSPAAVATPRAAAGKLDPSGCSGPAADVTCELWAMPSTTELLGTSVPIWGFSSSADPGSATAPGPVLVVDQGDTVTITVHNQLDEKLSLALPGQPADKVSHGLNDVDGAAPGAATSYTFTASRAGTFLYEAGHTPQGARQVAMGLSGALVVRDPSGQAEGNDFDDESVVVLSEIDPALNADPQHFDMREFNPGWRLINGRPFPSTSSIPTDVGHKVLLRYVNVGSQSHPMSLLGADQLQVAQDGHSMSPQREIVAQLDSGATADTIVSMPSGPDSKVTLFEEGQRLNNVGQTGIEPTRVASGGMMTFLDTAAPAPDNDDVGPAISHETATPSTSDGLADVTVSADVSELRSGNSNVAAAELLVDDSSVGVGEGLAMQGTFGGPTAHVTGTLPAHPAAGATCNDTPTPVALECLAAGKHHLYVRAQDDAGSHNWGVVSSVVLNLPKTGPATSGGAASPSPSNGAKALAVSATGDDSDADGVIDRAEMFIDTVGENATGTALNVNRSATIVSETGTVPASPPAGSTCPSALALSCLPEGTHHVFVHSHDDLGLWGPVLDVPFTVDRTGPGVDAVALSPNPSNGLISSPGNSGSIKVTAIITDKDGGGALQSVLAGAEGFFNPTGTPADGKGFQLLAVDGKFDSPSESVYGLIPLSQVKTKADGSYHVFVHGKDAAGNWGDRSAVDLGVDKTAPVLASVSGSPDPTNGAALLTLSAPVTKDTSFQTATFWTGTADLAAGKGTRVSVSYVDGKAVVGVPLTGLPVGPTRFNLRVQDMAGNWSNAVSTTVAVTKANTIFSDTFDSGDLLAWTSRTNMTGSSTVTTRSGSPALTVAGTGTHFVTDNSPSLETAYHAQFTLDTGTLSSNGNTVFDARSRDNGNGTVVTSVDYRKFNGATQVRLNLGRAGGTTVGPWVNLPGATTTVRVDWSSGPATGTSQGYARLLLDGAVATTLTGDTSALRIESARLGLVSKGATGTAYIDTFVSTRFTLP